MNATVILLCLMAVVATNAFSTGAPDDACFDMVPQHGVDPQKSAAPYRVELSTNRIRSGDKIEVTIQGLKRTDTIKGFMIQAQDGKTPKGKWFVDKSHPYGQILDCGEPSSANAVTHKKIDGDGVNNVKFTWQSSPDLAGKTIHFRATVAHNGGVFWVGVASEQLSVF